jgi:L-cysteine S-thiosulfotransferase
MIRPLLALLLIGSAAAEPRSGYRDASPETRAMQDDDASNPGFLWVAQGEALWSQPAGRANKSCADCHGTVSSLRGAAARYPAFDARTNRVVTFDQRIEQCRTRYQQASPLGPEASERLALSAYAALPSRGLPLAVAIDGPARPAFEAGRAFFNLRQGQLNLSCAQCHDLNPGQRLAGAVIPQGHPNGYPLYRLEWQSLGSLQRRLRNCLIGVRAEPLAPDAPEIAGLALYMAWRAQGLPVETPAVRP